MGAIAVMALLLYAFAGNDDEYIPNDINGDGDGDGDGDLPDVNGDDNGNGEANGNGEGMSQEEWLQRLTPMIHQGDDVTPGAFYQITGGGPTAEAIAGQLLGQYDSGGNRIRLIQCISRAPWNELYMSSRVAGSWGTAYNVDGRQLSAAWLPRHESALQALANRNRPTKNINEDGGSMNGGYFGMLWIPTFGAGAGFVSCTGNMDPPGWFMRELGLAGERPAPPAGGGGPK